MPTMTTGSRAPDGDPWTPTYQHAARYLLYRMDYWDATPRDRLLQEIHDRLPREARPGWELLCRDHLPPELEADALPTARWIDRFGASIGIRTPSVCEREL